MLQINSNSLYQWQLPKSRWNRLESENDIHFRSDGKKIFKLLTADEAVFTSNPSVNVNPTAMPRLLRPRGGDILIKNYQTLHLHQIIASVKNLVLKFSDFHGNVFNDFFSRLLLHFSPKFPHCFQRFSTFFYFLIRSIQCSTRDWSL